MYTSDKSCYGYWIDKPIMLANYFIPIKSYSTLRRPMNTGIDLGNELADTMLVKTTHMCLLLGARTQQLALLVRGISASTCTCTEG